MRSSYRLAISRVREDLRPQTRIREQFQENGMQYATIDDMRFFNAAPQRAQTGADFGDHAAQRDALIDHLSRFGGSKGRDERCGIVFFTEDAGGIGKQNQPFGAQRMRDLSSGDIGVDVISKPIVTQPERRDNGNETALLQGVEYAGVDIFDFADKADIQLLGGVADASMLQPANANEVRVLAGQAHRPPAFLVDARYDFFTDQSGEHHFGDIDGLFIGDAHSVDELRLFPQAFHQLCDLGAASMNDDGPHSNVIHQHDVSTKLAFQFFVDHRRAAVFDHDGFPVELTNIWEGFDQVLGELFVVAVQWPSPSLVIVVNGHHSTQQISMAIESKRRREDYPVGPNDLNCDMNCTAKDTVSKSLC